MLHLTAQAGLEAFEPIVNDGTDGGIIFGDCNTVNLHQSSDDLVGYGGPSCLHVCKMRQVSLSLCQRCLRLG